MEACQGDIMSAVVLKGSKQEIANQIALITGEIQYAVVISDEPDPPPTALPKSGEDSFAEMEPHTSDATHVDDSREAIYTPMEGE
jgi:hypothetical protein